MKEIQKFFFLAVVVLSSLSCQQNQKKNSKEDVDPPNVIFIVSEDNSPFLGCYGDTNAHTPNIDKLAEEGVLYRNAFAVAPVCAPSRSSIITGMYASSLGSHHMRSHVTIPDEFRFFPHYLQEAGYYTVNRQKKDYNIVDQPEVWDEDEWWEYEDMLTGRENDQPFFAMFNTFMSHESKIHGEREDDMLPYYKDAAISSQTGQSASQARIDSFNYMHKPGSIPVAPYHPTTPEMKEDWARYYDCISMMDDEVGELLDNLEEDGHLQNTIVFYFSDHGGVLGRSKRFTFESGLHVPFIVRFPEKYQHLAP
ncbi:MAG: sulfatase, partial [Bacteroidota bacterium]